MVVSSAAAIRYSKSLFENSKDNNSIEVTKTEIESILSLCKTNRDFKVFLDSPVISKDKKIEIFKSLFSGKVSDSFLGFLTLVAQHGREKLIPQIALSFLAFYNKENNIKKVELFTASPLSDSLRTQIINQVTETLKGKIELVENVDETLIGGYILRVGDKQIDATVKSSLRQVRQKFNS